MGSLKGGAWYEVINSLGAEIVEEINVVSYCRITGSQDLPVPSRMGFHEGTGMSLHSLFCMCDMSLLCTLLPLLVHPSPDLGTCKQYAFETFKLCFKSASFLHKVPSLKYFIIKALMINHLIQKRSDTTGSS